MSRLTHSQWSLPARGPECAHQHSSPRRGPRPHRPPGRERSTAGGEETVTVTHRLSYRPAGRERSTAGEEGTVTSDIPRLRTFGTPQTLPEPLKYVVCFSSKFAQCTCYYNFLFGMHPKFFYFSRCYTSDISDFNVSI